MKNTSKGRKENKHIFDELIKFQDEIKSSFGDELSWERLDNKKMCRVAYYKEGVNVFDKGDWQTMADFLTASMVKLEQAMREPLKKLRQRLNAVGES